MLSATASGSWARDTVAGDRRPPLKRTIVLIVLTAVLGGVSAYIFGRDDGNPGTPSRPVATGPAGDDGTRAAGSLAELDPDVLRCLAAPGPGNLRGPREDRPTTLAALARRVERLRGLRYERLPRPKVLGKRELDRRVRRLSLQSYSAAEARADERLLVALGALDPDANLRAEIEELLTSQVAGFYVPESGELVVGRFAGELGPLEEVTLAHELEHALADQNFGLPVDDRAPPAEADAQLAALALVEGDATLTMQRYALAHLTVGEQLSLAGHPTVAGATAALEGVPHYLRQMFQFPYLGGLAFACTLYREGGWAAVDRAYDRPPSTSAQVLFPERYLGDERAAEVPDIAAPDGWVVVRRGAFGAAPLLWLFQAPGGDPGMALARAKRKVAEWGGGEYALLERGGDHAVALVLVDRPGGGELCRALVQWYARAFPEAHRRGGPGLLLFEGDQDAAIACRGTEVRLGIGPSPAVARSLTG